MCFCSVGGGAWLYSWGVVVGVSCVFGTGVCVCVFVCVLSVRDMCVPMRPRLSLCAVLCVKMRMRVWWSECVGGGVRV